MGITIHKENLLSLHFPLLHLHLFNGLAHIIHFTAVKSITFSNKRTNQRKTN